MIRMYITIKNIHNGLELWKKIEDKCYSMLDGMPDGSAHIMFEGSISDALTVIDLAYPYGDCEIDIHREHSDSCP